MNCKGFVSIQAADIGVDRDAYSDGPRYGKPQMAVSWLAGTVGFGNGCTGPDPRYADVQGDCPDLPGDLRPPGGIVSDPDAEVTSYRHFVATGQSWRPIQAWPNGADIQGGDL